MQKVTILSLHLGYGGAERCIINLANSLVDKYKVEILSVYKLYNKPAFEIDERVNVRYLTNVLPNRDDIRYDLKHLKIFSLIKDFGYALKVLNLKRKRTIDAIDACDSDIIISSKVYFNKLLGEYKNNGVRAIGWEHNYNNHTKKEIKEFIKSCKYLDDVVLVNKELQEFYRNEFLKNNLKCQVRYIPNYIDDVSKTTTKYDNRNLIAVGRLEKVKGFDDLIKVYKLVNLKTQGTSLTLVGDGKQKNSLFETIVKNDLASKVKMTGYLFQDDIDKLYNNSCLYIMTSHSESFGLVMLEAMSHGLPVVAFSSAEGARELIQDGYNGYLINNRNEFEMADKIIELLNDNAKLKEMGQNAYISAKKYTKEVVIKTWEQLLDEKQNKEN